MMSKTQALVEAIGSGIVGGDLPEGFVLVPDLVQGGYGVSRTVVREAVQVLKTKGLVTVSSYRGTVVSPHKSWNLLDPDVVRWAPEGGWLRRDAAELADELRLLAAAKPHNGVLAYAARTYLHLGVPE